MDYFSFLLSEALPERLSLSIVCLLFAFITGFFLGPYNHNANPFLWSVVDVLFGKTLGRLDKPHRSATDLFFRGFFITVLVIFLVGAFGFAIQKLTQIYPYQSVLAFIFLYFGICSGAPVFVCIRLRKALDSKDHLRGAYLSISRSTRTDLSQSDDFLAVRAGAEYLAKSFRNGLVAPIFWYCVLGLPGLYLYGGITALSWRFGKEGFSKGFGGFSLFLDRVLGFVPDLLAAFFFHMACFFVQIGNAFKAFKVFIQNDNPAPYAEGGAALRAMAWCLNISLGGPRVDLDGSTIKKRWIGPPDATAQLKPIHLHRAAYISGIAQLLFLLFMVFTFLFLGDGLQEMFLMLDFWS